MKVPEFRILQYNTQKRLNAVQVPFLSDRRVREFDVIAIQEQGRAANAPQTHSPNSCPFHLVASTSQLSRACIYVNKNIDPGQWSAQATEPDLCSIAIQVEDLAGQSTRILIHSIYNPSPLSTSTTEGPSTIGSLASALQEDGPHIVLGDFNLHHPYWGGKRCYSKHAASDGLIEVAT